MDCTFAGARRTVVVACLAALAVVLLQPASAGALPAPWDPFDYNEAVVQQTGPEEMVYDWSVQKCENDDIPDEAARAFRDQNGLINIMDTHFWNYRFTTTSLTGTLTHPCTRTMTSTNSANQTTYDNKEWLASPWTADGQTVYALIHNEYQGGNFLTNCSTFQYQCWWNSITSAVSTNGGATFSNTSPDHVVASIPWQFTKDGPQGYFTPSNIVRTGDGWFYAMFRAEDYPNQSLPAGYPTPPPPVQQIGTCVMRTRDISNPKSWRAWNGSGFSARFVNPYIETSINPADHICAPVDLMSIGTVSENLFWSTYFKKWVLVGNSAGDPNFPEKPPGVYYALSDDLIQWTDLKLLFAAEITFKRDCVPPDPIKEVSILDPNSTSRNFTTVGQNALLFYTWYHQNGCNGTLDRDLIRVPIQFTDPTPP